MERDFYIDDWLINPQSAEIRRGDEIVKLEPKVMDLLIYLVEHCDQVVSREQIHDEVWKGVVVGDDALTAAIIKLRKALDDDSRNPRFIQTIPKKGYRLIAETGKPDESPCGEHKLERKLTAIFYADVVEYSRLTSRDEEGTHRTLSVYLDQMSQAIEHHNGHVIHYAGDAVLAEFNTIIDALIAAVDIQRRFAERNAQVDADKVIKFRIGINLGDVIVDRDDIYGEGVNIAARLESLADPGGICISESVRSAAGNKLDLNYEFMGEQSVKNIDEPVRAYRVLMAGETPATSVGANTRRRRVISILVSAVLVVMVALTWLFWADPDQKLVTEQALALPDKPSIAVMPFVNSGSSREDDYFSNGITDDLITDLSRISGLFVISRNSTFQYRGQVVDSREAARALGVRYILTGNVRRSEQQVRINTRLIDGTTGGQVWADRYDGDLRDVFELQDEVTRQIVQALQIELTPDDAAQQAIVDTTSFEAYDEYLKGWEQYRLQTRESFNRARLYFQKALEFDPAYSRAHASLALLFWEAASKRWFFNRASTASAWGQIRRELNQAMLNPTPLALNIESSVFLHNRRYDSAIESAERAIQLDRNSTEGYRALANALVYSGKPEQAIDVIRKAIRLDPNATGPHLEILGHAQCELRDFHAAEESLARAIESNRNDYGPYLILISCLGQSDQMAKAQPLIEQVDVMFQREFKRHMSVDWWWRDGFPYQDKSDRQRFLDGLRRAGVPES